MSVYFCERSGVRIVAPGVARSAGGTVDEWAAPGEMPRATWNGMPFPEAPIAAPEPRGPANFTIDARPQVATTRPRRAPARPNDSGPATAPPVAPASAVAPTNNTSTDTE